MERPGSTPTSQGLTCTSFPFWSCTRTWQLLSTKCNFYFPKFFKNSKLAKMKSSMQKIYREIFPKPQTKKFGCRRKKGRGRRTRISSKTCPKLGISFGEIQTEDEKKDCKSLDPEVILFDENSPEFSLGPITTPPTVDVMDEGYDSRSGPSLTSIAKGVLSTNSRLEESLLPHIVYDQGVNPLPEKFDVELIQVDGVFKIRASESALKYFATWVEQNARRLKRDGISSTGNFDLTLPSLQLVVDLNSSDSEKIINQMDDKLVALSGSEMLSPSSKASDKIDVSSSALDLVLTSPELQLTESKVDSGRFSEILKELGLNSIDDLDLEMDVSGLDVGVNVNEDLSFGVTLDFWTDLEISDKEIKGGQPLTE